MGKSVKALAYDIDNIALRLLRETIILAVYSRDCG